MATHAAFLRGINLGRRRVKSDELRRIVEGLGLDDVATFRASGNLIMSADADRAELSERLEAGLEDGLGYEVLVFLRSAAELLEIARRGPFSPGDLAASRGKPQIILLRQRPSRENGQLALALAGEDDRLELAGSELHWLPGGGISESELDLKGIEAALGPTTIRTSGTIEQIAARHFS